MNCETCEDRLLDLLYEELAGDEAEEARRHVRSCASCGASYEKLSSAHRLATHLPELDPPRSLDDPILAAARQKVGAAVAEPVARPEDAEDDEGLWASILRWMGSVAMGPQVAMATVMLLVVAIGLWYYPSSRRGPEAAGGSVISPDHAGEAAPSATLEPAAPLDLDIDPRTGRMRSRGEQDEARSGGRNVEPRASAETDEGFADRRAAEGGLDRDDDGEAAGNVIARALDGMEAQAPAERERGAGESLAASPTDAPAQRGRRTQAGAAPSLDDALAESTPTPMGTTRSPTRARMPQAQRPSTAAGGAAPPSAPAAEMPQAPLSAAEEGSSGLYRRGVTRFSRGDFRGAAQDFEQVARGPGRASEVPNALYNLARSQRRAGNCAAAITQYQRYLARYPTHPDRATALLDLGRCYRQQNRLGDARRTFEAAVRHRSVARTAQRELVVIGQMERAARRPVSVDEAEVEAASEAAY